ncbi:hypothetical protein SAMD00019534_057680, partial [Acytostelium subglobosum LB1]|uniref:hypothetical protein n=1 Tax=Acytostelium subglobosum LB1 TaxID=1410327 RepID=UPI0006450367
REESNMSTSPSSSPTSSTSTTSMSSPTNDMMHPASSPPHQQHQQQQQQQQTTQNTSTATGATSPTMQSPSSLSRKTMSSPATGVDQTTPEAIRARGELQLQVPDSIMSIDIAQTMKDYITTGGSPPDVIRFLSESYRGYAQMCNLLCSWMSCTGVSNETILATVKGHLKDIIMEKFDPKKADTIFSS